MARFGGDEFAILVPEVTDPETAEELAARIGKLLAVPFSIKGHKVRITSSIGIALFSPETASPEAMMMQADLALYGAKDDGRDCYRFHSHDLDLEVHERVRVAEELRVALDQGELELYYQPQVELATGRIIGLEALIRWNHKTRGVLTPASFIPIAERTGIGAADRQLGVRGGLPPAQALARRGHRAAGAVGQRVGRPVQGRLGARTRDRGEPDAMGHRPLPS